MISIEPLLSAIRAVRERLAEHRGLHPLGGRRPDGTDLELVARRAVLEALGDRLEAVTVVIGPDRAPAALGLGAPSCRLFVDLDGLENLARGLGPATLSIAVLPPEGPISLEAVRLAVVGSLDDTRVWWTTDRGAAVSSEGKLRVASTRDVTGAFVSVDGQLRASGVAPRATRSFGCTAASVCMVADGRLDAHVGPLADPVALLAALTIARRAGVYLSLEHARDGAGPERIVASATLPLARQLVAGAPERADWSVLPAASGGA